MTFVQVGPDLILVWLNLYLYEARRLTCRIQNTSSLSKGKVRKFEEETQLQSKGVLVKGFCYLLEYYIGLVVCYPILVRISSLSSGYVLFCEISLGEIHCTCW